jgi:hypothetical protein
MMSPAMKGVTVLAVQMALVLSVAAKYGWERKECSQVWARAGQYDPDLPLRGRYLALNLTIDSCGLPRNEESGSRFDSADGRHVNYSWVVTTMVKDGKLVARAWDKVSAVPTEEVIAAETTPCAQAILSDGTEFFVSEKAKLPELKKGQELWALVTVPPQGPPRPVELAVSDARGWRVLQLR